MLQKLRDWLFAIALNDFFDTSDDGSRKLLNALVTGIACFVAAVVVLSVLNVVGHWRDWPLGTFGDFFGGVLNPIVTGFTLIALSLTIILQRSELRHTKNAAGETKTAMRLQAFETTFFNMLNLHSSIVTSLSFDPDLIPTSAENRLMERTNNYGKQLIATPLRGIVHGRQVFGEVLNALSRGQSTNRSRLDVYRLIQNQYNGILGHYYRNLYQILNFIDAFAVKNSAAEMKTYVNIVRAQLSSEELVLLFYNCSGGTVDYGRFRYLVKKFEFLEHMPLEYHAPFRALFLVPNDTFQNELFAEYLDVGVDGSGIEVVLAGAFGKHPAVGRYVADINRQEIERYRVTEQLKALRAEFLLRKASTRH